MVSSEEIEPTTLSSMREAAKAIGMGDRVIMCARDNGRDFIKRVEGGSVKGFPFP